MSVHNQTSVRNSEEDASILRMAGMYDVMNELTHLG